MREENIHISCRGIEHIDKQVGSERREYAYISCRGKKWLKIYIRI